MPLRSSGDQHSETESPYAQHTGASQRTAHAGSSVDQPEAKSLMLGVADDYEHLTQIAEAMALIRSVLASAIEHDASETGQ